MNRVTDDQAAHVLGRWIGATGPKRLGHGMEGVVYEVDDSRVAKIWHSGSVEALHRTSAFYAALDAGPVTLAVPRIEEVHTVDQRVVTIERRLAGTTLSEAVAAGRVRTGDAHAAMVDVLADLASGGPLPAGRALSVLDEQAPLFGDGEDFPAALARLAARRLDRFRPVLGAAVDGVEEKAAALAGRLREVDSGRRAVIHGDLIPANVLVDDAGDPSAVLDWGFLSTEGDPAFDAAVTAAIFDMYGDNALETELALYDRIAERLGHDRVAMLVYRAAYSLITANAYDAQGRDGHFAWCAAALNRADVTRALLG
ncbi:hypothetical protein Lfu02_72370 [Longispora fulva]|uniref:Aminoglycoside phosphotransferase (APT) family kinase protein n=1 Tax=Longispora fulva TaxID=619741 RepID=A0A8J7GAK9_9ACTN|nr:aminoglycoside phosphotransferase family protein [Longispora fulva]MBG6133826.1 aminoglycoside phosphotransferase (APT) family kinase protein [Longispora fulva]GIG62865.1 hypothetical protein Lfu02_72370 [Longispora fulva]